MENIKSILAKLATGKKLSDSDIKKLVFGKNSTVIEKITRNLDQTSNIAKAIKQNPKILKDVLKNKAIERIRKYMKK